jgi:small subunit ribosomal protein S3
MGQKISTKLLRAKKILPNVTNNSAAATDLQTSVWFAKGRTYAAYLLQDKNIKEYLYKKLSSAGVVNLVIRRYFRRVEISIFVTKPGIVIGKGGSLINQLKDDLVKKFGLPTDVKIDINEFKDPLKSANVIGTELSEAIQRGAAYRRLAKMYIEKIKYSGVLGCKISVAGRLNGAEIARTENFTFGSVPRHTIDANIDYAQIHCKTKAGILGIKVWVYTGDKFVAFNSY